VILEIDAGNTMVKWRLRQGADVKQRGFYHRNDDFSIELDGQQRLDAIYISSVAGAEYEDQLSRNLVDSFSIQPWFARSTAACAGVCNSYQSPELMGVDRWLAMLAAYNDGAGAVCVVDAGSALTIDFVMVDGVHLGGYIVPGSELMKAALLKNTDRVRFEGGNEEKLEPGTSTLAAVNNGVLLSQAGAIKLALDEACQSAGQDYKLYICGGDGEKLQQALAIKASYRPELVMDGLTLAVSKSEC